MKKETLTSIDKKSEHYWKIAKSIWEYAELGYLEFKSTELLQQELKSAGFSIESGVADIPTAFIASPRVRSAPSNLSKFQRGIFTMT